MTNVYPNKQLDASTLRISLFPALLPAIHRRLVDSIRSSHPNLQAFAEVLSAPVLMLLPTNFRVQIVLYTSCAAILHSARKSGLSKSLPPIWTLNMLGNAWLLWALVFCNEAFPKAYARVTIAVRSMAISSQFVLITLTRTYNA